METLNTLKYANRARNIKNKVSPGNSLAYVIAFNAGDTFSLLSVVSPDQTIATQPCHYVELEDASRSTNVLHSVELCWRKKNSLQLVYKFQNISSQILSGSIVVFCFRSFRISRDAEIQK